jgi:hypothetical protein
MMKNSYEISGPNKVTHVHQIDFIKERYKGFFYKKNHDTVLAGKEWTSYSLQLEFVPTIV